MANFTTLFAPPHRTPLYYPKPPNINPFNYSFFYCRKFIKPSKKFKRKPDISISCSNPSLKGCFKSEGGSAVNIWEDSHCVEVIGIGSRVDSVLDFCLSSPSPAYSLRFWNVIKGEKLRAQLHRRFLGKDDYPTIMEAPQNQQSHLKTVVLVASAGYGDDYVIAADILRTIRSGGGLVVAIILKPFSFEGQRRQDEVKILVDKLQECVNFCIDIDIDTLLKMDMVTLDEALKTAYRAVSAAIAAVSVLVSDTHQKHIHSLHDIMELTTIGQIVKVTESYKDGKVGFGVGHNVEASIIQAVYDCPFLSMGLKDLDGVVMCVVSSSGALGDDDVCVLLHTFRQATECTKEVLLSIVHDPDMKPSLIATTVITVCVTEAKSFQKSSILSRLADSIPFVFNFLRKHHMQSDNPNSSNPRENMFPPMRSGKETVVHENCDKKQCDDDGTNWVRDLDGAVSSSNYIQHIVQGAQAGDREPLISRNFGPEYRIAQELGEDEVNISGAVPVADNPRIFHLPVGVKLSHDFHESFDLPNSEQPVESSNEDAKVQVSAVPSISSMNGFTDAGFEVVTDFWNSASTLWRGKQLDATRKQGVLSARAASMLEAERDSKTRWSPVMQIQYRGGIYKGRCQGGLPEGRGRLAFSDGSVYEGMWRYGKRSGLGSFFFSNGDFFHGSWRDDLMHGKGWLYFHTGERLFANFWKGRANGEGRFYSKSGEVFFGHFEDGWRHGHFLCVKFDGTRYVEIWNEGILVSCQEMDSLIC